MAGDPDRTELSLRTVTLYCCPLLQMYQKTTTLDGIGASLGNFPCPQMCHHGTGMMSYRHFPFVNIEEEGQAVWTAERNQESKGKEGDAFPPNFHTRLIPNRGCSDPMGSKMLFCT